MSMASKAEPLILNDVEKRMLADYEWVNANLELQKEYPGKVLAVYNREILAIGTTHANTLEAASAKRPDLADEIVTVVVLGRILEGSEHLDSAATSK